jgi:hypothetical protein
MGALLSLDISSNRLRVKGTKLLAKALKSNQTMTSLNVSFSNMTYDGRTYGDMSGVAALADVIPGMRALTSLDVSSNDLGRMSSREGWIIDGAGDYISPEGKDHRQNKPDGVEFKPFGVIALAGAIPDMGALTSLHVGQNSIRQKEIREIIAIAMGMDSMKILCEVPFKDKTLTELDVSGKNLGTEGALVVAEYLKGNEAMTSLNLANNNIGELVHPQNLGWTREEVGGSFVFRHPDGREQPDAPKSEPVGAIALANAIPDMRALTCLNLASNSLGVEGAKIIAACLPKCM